MLWNVVELFEPLILVIGVEFIMVAIYMDDLDDNKEPGNNNYSVPIINIWVCSAWGNIT